MRDWRPFLSAEWRHLAMYNVEVDPTALDPLIPAGTELDFWNGKTFLSIVGFQFLGTRVYGVPIPFHRNFAEVNLRFYVRRNAEEGWRRGVVFVREFVPRRAVAFVARRVYNEPYAVASMKSEIHVPDAGSKGAGSTKYSWKFAGSVNVLEAIDAGEAKLPAPGSEEEFITEHYWGYTRLRDGATAEYEVGHPRWLVRAATNYRFKCDAAACYGTRFCEALSSPPTSVFVADGSPVVVHRGRRLPQSASTSAAP
jgi:uncharacterized protein YqjF (DUF2071 family)